MNTTTGEGENSSSLTSERPFRLFSLPEIQYATKNFDEELLIGQGGFGKVFKGYISSDEVGHVVAIKRLDSMSDQGEHDFRAEIDMLSKLRHCHLVSLIGYCHETNEKILVYEYMSNGTLYHHLHKAETPLSWLTRLNIAIGASRGLECLHTNGVIHRDVKSTNILLDEHWVAMISDFGLSKIGTPNQPISCVNASVKGTFGYLDPEYFYTRKLTRKSNVYSFGVVLFELLSGRLAVDEINEEDECSLVRWAQRCVKERKLDQIVESNIKGTISSKCLKRFVQIADCCVHSNPKERPTMTKVVATLHALRELQEKYNAESSQTMGFTWRMHKYLLSATKSYSDQSGTSFAKILDNNMNQHEELVNQTDDELKTFLDQRTSFAKILDNNMNQHEELVNQTELPVLRCTSPYDELKLATWLGDEFTYSELKLDTWLGTWKYGMVYKGWVGKTTNSNPMENTELSIAVKILHHKKHFDQEMLKEFVHPNLHKLIGYGLEGERDFLVYEFMHKGNLADLLCRGVVAQLSLVTKVKIVVGIARGVVFLQKTRSKKGWSGVGESSLDRRNILLDEDFTPKLSGYDVSTLVDGEYNIACPNVSGALVVESNLSGYEVVFVEVLTGERIYSSNTLEKIDRLFRLYGKESLKHVAKFSFEICNEVDSESKMLTMLNEYDLLIRSRLKLWLRNTHS